MKNLVTLLRAACSAVLLALVVTILWGWITREFGNQARWSEELARLLLVWLSLLGAALAYADRAHLGIDLLTGRFDAATARLAALLGHGATAVFALVVLLVGGGALTWERWQSGQLLAALQIPKAWMYAAAPLSGLAFLAFALVFLREAWIARPASEEEART
jgi:TRAP-type C4-dicarboxylate transport system permease small subunit